MRASAAIVCLIVALSPLFFSQVSAEETVILRNQHSLEVHVIQTGAIIQKLYVPDYEGTLEDIVTGFDNLDDYTNYTLSQDFFGAAIGRVANRIGNATFELDGKRYYIPANDNNNALHGGKYGWSVKTWNLTEIDSDEGHAVQATYVSPNGDEGFPGEVHASVTYTLTPDNEVLIDFEATSDQATPISMTQHSYFNLNGPGAGKTILDHNVFLNGSYITPANNESITLGTFQPVAGTPYDFERVNSIGSRINAINTSPPGYDINYVLWGLNGPEAKQRTHDCVIYDEPELAMTVSSPDSGRVLDLYTQTPGLQFYTGNSLNGSAVGKNNQAYPRYGAFAAEAQDFPNFVNEPAFPQCILNPGQIYKYRTVWRFTTQPPSAARSPSTAST